MCSSDDSCDGKGIKAEGLPVPMAMLVRRSSQRLSNVCHRLSSKIPNAHTFCHTPKTIKACLTNVCTVKVSASSRAKVASCDGSCSNVGGGGRGNTDFMKKSVRLLYRYVERWGYVAGDGRHKGQTGTSSFRTSSPSEKATGRAVGNLGRLVQ